MCQRMIKTEKNPVAKCPEDILVFSFQILTLPRTGLDAVCPALPRHLPTKGFCWQAGAGRAVKPHVSVLQRAA